jgi:dienelactone hydrolase
VLFAKREKRQVWAALCTAHADGAVARHRADAKHATLVMVTAPTRIIVAGNDELVPRSSSDRLRARFREELVTYLVGAWIRAQHHPELSRLLGFFEQRVGTGYPLLAPENGVSAKFIRPDGHS